ncbi:MAG: tRNA (N6-threonylcarbamoyladenosine(37)-N6)-methyltransferase TrmO [Anaerolineales bacterium]|nr:tRNA (N6-threonylcarbamoyladenosine(37)-N6)-methyltransferase TrmO [Anaerolineales bacterium]
MNDSLSLAPIGFVKSQFEVNTPAEEMRLHPAQIILKTEFEPGLLGLEAGMDILVLFCFHRIQEEEIKLQLHPRHNPENPVRGVFATRSQFRPNRIGATVARIEQVNSNILTLSGLDAQDAAPVLDIKPYEPYSDADTGSQQLEVHQVSSLAEARAAIDLIDAEVIRLLGNRAGYVRQVVNFKNTPEDVRAPARYAEVMRRRRELAEANGLNPDVIEGMYKLLVDNFIQEEMEMLREKEKKQGN